MACTSSRWCVQPEPLAPAACRVCVTPGTPSLCSQGFHNFGFNRHNGAIFYREWAPAATGASLIGDFNSWNPTR